MEITKEQEDLLREFKKTLKAWNATHNLVSSSQTKELDSHILDSLSIKDHLTNNIVDLGSGGGFPGIPLAIALPKNKFFLIESNQKKAAFLLHTSNKLCLTNTTIINQRAEAINVEMLPLPIEIITRAFGTLISTLKVTGGLLQLPGTKLKIMKTSPWDKEKPPKGYTITDVQPLETKDKNKGRFLVTIEKTI